MKKSLLSLAVGSAILSQYSFAENKLEEVIVSATLNESTVFDINGSATVINASELDVQQPLDLSEIFERQAGLDIIANGGRASQTSLFTRGTNSDHTLILIDGQRFGSATLGSTQFQFIDPEMLERVEIVRGARSVLYGSDAIGGLVNLVPKIGEEFSAFVGAEYGSNDTRRFSGGINNKQGNFYYTASLSHEKSDGIDALIDDSNESADEDSYEILNGNVRVAYQFGNDREITVSHYEAQSEVDFDNQYNSLARPYSDTRLAVSKAKLQYRVNDLYDTQMHVGYSVNDSENFDHSDGARTGFFETKRDELYWLNNFRFNDILSLNAGVDYIDETVDSLSGYLDEAQNEIDSRDNLAVFVQAKVEVGVSDTLIGVRRDDNSAFGEETTLAISEGIQLGDHHRVYLSWAEGFKAPTFNDMYWPNAGNPDLEAEVSDTREVGLKGKFESVQYEISLFDTNIENLIEWAPIDESGFIWLPSNIAEADIKGAEFWVNTQLWSWNFDASISYVDPENSATGETLADRAKRKFTFDARREHERLSYGVNFVAQSERAVSFGEPLPGFGLWGIYMSANITDALSAKLKINNIFDKEYQLDERYNVDGTNGNVKLVYKF